MTFRTEALPSGPVCKTRRPSRVRIGKIRSNVSRSHPAKIEILPVAARWHPPETGQSTAAPPLAMIFSPKRLTSVSSLLDISIQIFPGEMPSSKPFSPSITAADAAGDGKHVITASQSRIIAAGLSPALAPWATKVATSASSKSCTTVSKPFRTSDPASFPPTLPNPMKPIFISISL